MHYKNKREAKEGDDVITNDYNGKIVGGKLYNLKSQLTSCHCDIAILIPGGSQQLTCQNVNNMYHAEDAFAAIEQLNK